MRAIFLIFWSLMLFSSCQKEENEFIGTWKVGITFINNSQKALDDCERKEIVIFTEKNFISQSYKTEKDGTCLLEKIEVPYKISEGKLIFSLGETVHRLPIKHLGDFIEITSTLEDGRKLVKKLQKTIILFF
ncbi:lipocalin family protein [Capnocytophaga canimorsus]|nr:lipocalin family protein [Capnocytophaga canimorsus]WGU67927.1 lipocalin family protein [Capnocytophaga canimorsus]WGU70973.1 lipocalin family protein [Capnocytophaga canimorsus]